ncbi:MAG: hypothetical protein HQM03_08960 [Magnetococcales bacterium]|nr:hypothetical protein [Magnetococcales bacterium]
MRKTVQYQWFLYFLAFAAAWFAPANDMQAGGFTPDMNPMAPGMMGVADQGDAVEMGQRLGKFMGSFMREMKNTPEGVERAPRAPEREYHSYPESRRDVDPRDRERDYDRRGEATRVVPQYVTPPYDPWGAGRGTTPLLDNDPWGSGSGSYSNRSYSSPYYGPGGTLSGPSGWGDSAPSQWAEQEWRRSRGYYGAGLAPWEYHDQGPDPRAERRWRDPSYYDRDYDPRDREATDGAYGHPSPWSGGYDRGSRWW